jgi:hypothetical protein
MPYVFLRVHQPERTQGAYWEQTDRCQEHPV